MYQLSTLKNGLTLITINLPHLDSVTTMLAVGAGSRYETRKINGISHFLEHMFFKGSKKYPTAQIISTMIDSIGAVNNAGTDKEVTFYWIKSAAKQIDLASDILSSMVSESLLSEEEITREKGVIVEELRMYEDNPARRVFDLYEQLQLGDQPLGWDIGGSEKTVTSLTRSDVVQYMDSHYSPKNMALIYVGNLPKDVSKLAEKYFLSMGKGVKQDFEPFKNIVQKKPQVSLFYKKTDQANLILGVKAYHRDDPKRYAAKLLATILGEGMSSRLFIQIRERRGLAYHVAAFHNPYKDVGYFAAYAGLKLEKIEEGIEVMRAEMLKTASEPVTADELKKAKEMERGRIALRSESTNFLAEHFGLNFVIDREIETFEEYLKHIDEVTADDIKMVAQEIFKPANFNLQIIGPFKDSSSFEKILNS